LECQQLGTTKANCNLHVMPDDNLTSTKLWKTDVYCHNYTCLNQTEIATTCS
jgi:hypothetical protein